MTQVIVSNKRILTSIARRRPRFRVLDLISTGRRLETMEMKMILSIPKTTSKNVRVNKASQASA
jgi:hypothetical protein